MDDEIDKILVMDSNDRIEFIEVLSDEIVESEIYNINPLALPAEQLITLLTKENGGVISVEENEVGYFFHNIAVSLWRELSPSDVMDMINESKQEGVYDDMKDEISADLEKSRKFTTIGIRKTE